ncbi:MAG: PSD1 and planctomycete cytochrome C domain-containing protein [Isosphaeraceae bacterium]
MSAFRQSTYLAGLLFLIAQATADQSRGAEPPARPVSFSRDVRPVLARHCYACHGPDAKQRKAGLRLDLKADAFAELKSGSHAFMAGSLDESAAIERVTSEDASLRMPPGGPEKQLNPEQIGVLKRWVSEGAKWETHWSFEPPVRPPLPSVSVPGWVRNPIDRFVLARLDAEGLKPSPEADRAVLIRRVSLDLTGLPPDPADVEAFVRDNSPDAYEALVDRLLKSPAYGERWARVWLDLARYADTKGYEKDLRRSIWRYRDWVVDAFNTDMPFDRFTVEQLAGDMLPNATPSQVLATAFHRNTLCNDEGGTDDEEFRVAAVKDRVDTTGQVWMGLTLGCAKCHSHKYDPISNQEYYQFYAFFNQTADADRYDDGPAEPFPDAARQARLDGLKAEIAAKEAARVEPTPARLAALEKWEASAASRRDWSTLAPCRVEAASKASVRKLKDGSLLVSGVGPAKETYTVVAPALPGRLTAVRVEAIPDASLPKGGVGRSKGDGNFVLTGLTVTLRTKRTQPQTLKLSRAEADFAQDRYPVAHVLNNPVPAHHGWAVSPRQAEPHQAIFHLAEPVAIDPADEADLTVTLDHRFEFDYPGFSLGRFRVSTSGAEKPAFAPTAPADVLAALDVPATKRTQQQTQVLLKHLDDTSDGGKADRDAIVGLKAEVDAILASVKTPIFRELPKEKRRVTKVHNRGNFLDQGEAVEPATPSAFHPFPKDAPRDRLGVARWLTDPTNPLTARVAVNRHWAQFFGRGLVETQEDFGSQGQPPSHPELLDWLAVEFRDGGWSMKQLCRLIVTSATYRQSSRATPELLKRDRPNRLLARGPRFRLEAEMIRDSALAVSGLLSRKMGGPPVMPHQPEGIWKSTYNTDKWILSPGEDRYRRGLYTFLKRTSPYPAMLAFDAPSREVCTVRRVATNTPLQALVTLNDPAFVAAAQGLARRMAEEGGDSADARIAKGVNLALGRPARPSEVAALTGLYERRLAYFRTHPGDAKALATDPISAPRRPRRRRTRGHDGRRQRHPEPRRVPDPQLTGPTRPGR